MSLLTFEELKNKPYFKFEEIIEESKNYYAHLPKDDGQEKEELTSHSNLVLKYALKLIEKNSIEKSLNMTLSETTDKEQMQNDIKLFFLKAIYWHDIGKLNDNFQVDKMNNINFKKVNNGIGSKHSILSSYLYLVHCFDYINSTYQDIKNKISLISISISFAMTIWRHHSGITKSVQLFISDQDEGLPICNQLDIYLEKLNLSIDDGLHKKIMDNLINGDLKNHLSYNENYFLLSKSLFSLLIISDYYATAQFMNYGNKENKLEYKDFGLIDKAFSDKLYKELYIDKYDSDGKKKTFNQSLKDKKNDDFKSFCELWQKSNDNLNHLRNKLFVEVRTNLQKSLESDTKQNLFYIEAPTGAGKTNLSMMSVVEILKKDTSVNKVFYVFPFTTLITQTYESIKSTLNLNDSEIVQLHSKAKYNQKTESKKDGIYGDEKTNFLDNQFMNYPIALLSHVKFFDILSGVSKNDNYIFHRLANSVVVIDEIQTYNPSLWSSIVYMLDKFAKSFNIKFIVMSATLPKIGDIIDSNFTFLVSRENKQKYFQNPNFGKRVEIFEEKKEVKDVKSIYARLIEESKNYQQLESNESNKVKTIIEFITKKGADEFYKEAKDKNENFFDEVFILSGTILEPRRKEIIDFIKKYDDKNILLVTTQVVEAGIDIDMDIGFKEKSLLDSDEQLAGRINRNSSKSGNKLFLFEMENPKAQSVYKGDKRLKADRKNVLENKDFDYFYNQIIKKIIDTNETPYIENLNSYKDHIKNLRFNDAHIKLIDMESVSVFVPWCDEAIKVWKEYESIVLNKNQNVIDKKISLKQIASEISQYTFSLASYKGSGVDYLKDYGEEKYGYLYLDRWDTKSDGKKLYDYKDGLETSILKGEFVSMII